MSPADRPPDLPPGPPLPHMLAAELARVRVAVARAKDDLAHGRMPNLQDLQSLVAGVCGSAVQAIRSDAAASAGPDAGLAATLETLLVELNALEDEVQKYRARTGGDE